MAEEESTDLKPNELGVYEVDSLEILDYRYAIGSWKTKQKNRAELHLSFHIRGTPDETRVVMRIRSRETAETILSRFREKMNKIWPLGKKAKDGR
jgi:hypothetical protein